MIRRLLISFLLLASAAAQVIPGSGGAGAPTSAIVGQIQTATGGTINHGTLTFILSQPAIAVGNAAVATQVTACYTASGGNIVGLPDPRALPILSVNTASGTAPAGVYYVEIFYTNSSGLVSAVSPEASINLTSQGTVIANPPLLQPSSASGYGVAMSLTPGAETIQGTVTGFTQYQQKTPISTGSVPAATNNSVCNLYFSDQLIPTGTYYTVNLTNRNATQVAGFPQTWCTYGGAGGTINVSQGAPTGSCNTNGVFYPTPLFSSPPNGALSQSVFSALNLGSFGLTAGPITATSGTFSGAVTSASSGSFSGLNVNVSGTGCTKSLQLTNVDTGPTNPNKYFRVNQSTGALELMNSACGSTPMLSLDESGNAIGILSMTAPSGLSPLTITAGNTTHPSPFAGNDVLLVGGGPAPLGGQGGGVTLNGAPNALTIPCVSPPCLVGTLKTNTYFSTWTGISTAGQGLTSIRAATPQKPETAAADANVLTLTPPAVAGTYRACVVVSVSSASSGVISWTLSWTDSNGNAQSNIAQDLFQQGTAAPNTTFTTSSAGNYNGCTTFDVNNAAANVVVKWVGGGTSAAKVSATIEQVI